ncbi:hypothetical protein [Blastopirellula marina]|uniref:Uncharacterized protein n=1 Tax=Blastopirellula marina TaxID=124 RepID=A0A2S8GSP7_9BACT|nr:hypothetical protein [Blastopirellula marina]PQO36501.1 hypothetical protein C5Y98_12440 [Blastopirellula marina]PQO47452.1 hypothetical protein C5Y93_05255 [Blastopirellula marina]PTL44339.1 hypothetical protein C5Y97_12450 [Blastopirellula marina]
MSQTSACDNGFEFCQNQLKQHVHGFCPCDGCMSRFSCRGYGQTTVKSRTAAVPADERAPSERFIMRFDVSYATVKNEDCDVCTTA